MLSEHQGSVKAISRPCSSQRFPVADLSLLSPPLARPAPGGGLCFSGVRVLGISGTKLDHLNRWQSTAFSMHSREGAQRRCA